MPVPEADPVAYARMKYEQENRKKKSMLSSAAGLLKHGPDVSMAAKSGTPAMTSLRPNVPASVPVPPVPAGGTPELTITQVQDSKELDSKPDARLGTQGASAAAATAAAGAQTSNTGAAATTDTATKPAAEQQVPLPTNHQGTPAKQKKKKNKKTPAATTPAQPAAGQPAATTPAATPATTAQPQQQ